MTPSRPSLTYRIAKVTALTLAALIVLAIGALVFRIGELARDPRPESGPASDTGAFAAWSLSFPDRYRLETLNSLEGELMVVTLRSRGNGKEEHGTLWVWIDGRDGAVRRCLGGSDRRLWSLDPVDCLGR